ncbi:type VI secretion system Vgr family protein [Ideonella sp. YS5]|uniref:type VI secretion system Vgr family protein n=1 Tax=Ideonella sp. YS5 TaxID=3453714 RepID=UPI003EE88187
MNLDDVTSFLGGLSSERRLYRLEGSGDVGQFHVEAFTLHEALHQPWRMVISGLAEPPQVRLPALRWQRVTLVTTLADGSEHRRTGLVEQAAATDEASASLGSLRLTRLRLTVMPWLGLLAYDLRSDVWQEKTRVQIIDGLLGHYARHGRWRWSPCALQHLADQPQGGLLSYCVQYRETRLEFFQRMLADAGLTYRFEETGPDEPAILVILADTTSVEGCPEDLASASLAGGAGLRYHREAPVEEQDTLQAFDAMSRWSADTLSAVTADYKSSQLTAASVPTLAAVGGARAPTVETFAYAGAYAWPDAASAEQALTLAQQAMECRRWVFTGRGVVRSFSAGSFFHLNGTPMDELGGLAAALPASLASPQRRYLLVDITHVGINNLPTALQPESGADPLLRPGVELLAELPGVDAELKRQAAQRGYANRFDAIDADTPWRPLLPGAPAGRLAPRPRVPGPLLATVVGPDGRTKPQGADELHMDRLGRVRVRFEFQGHPDNDPDASLASTWVRVLQPIAGPGLSSQWIPRIGHEVVVGFLNDDAERPVVLCSLYNGRGEGGVPATPGGKPAEADTSVFGMSADHRPAGQGNLTAGHSPAWHGGAPQSLQAGGQANAAALSGLKTQEFGGAGFNQLVFDDTDGQSRVQLATTQHATQLNMGHLVHQADNHRGSFRGLGFELRTDAYGALRGARGVLLSTYAANPTEPALDQAAHIALARQYTQLAQTFSQAAGTHQGVRLAAHEGSTGANASVANEAQAPAQAWLTNASGMADASADKALADAASRLTSVGPSKLPHPGDPALSVAARAGLVATAAQDIAIAAGDVVSLASGGRTDIAAGGAARIHTGQAIGIVAGAIEPGVAEASPKGTGLTMIAGSGDLSLQAQAGTLQLAAQQDLTLQSATGPIKFQAAKRIVIANSHGSRITLSDGKIVIECAGTYTVHASTKSLVGPQQVSVTMPLMPKGELKLEARYAFSL